MGWKGPRTLDVTLPEDLREKAGNVRIVTCRYFGEGRQQRVKTRREVRQMERWEKMGKVISEAADAHAAKVKAGKVDKPDPEKMLLAVFPPDLVCAQVVRAISTASGCRTMTARIGSTTPTPTSCATSRSR